MPSVDVCLPSDEPIDTEDQHRQATFFCSSLSLKITKSPSCNDTLFWMNPHYRTSIFSTSRYFTAENVEKFCVLLFFFSTTFFFLFAKFEVWLSKNVSSASLFRILLFSSNFLRSKFAFYLEDCLELSVV